MKSIYDKTLEQLEEYFESIGEKKFKARQLYDWLYKKRVTSFDEMTNIKKELRTFIASTYTMEPLKILERQKGDDVVKYLFELKDGNKIEAVLMLHDYGNSLCVSSQVGCNMSCTFCESGRLKKVRNLDPSEMVLQIMMIEKDLDLTITHLVLMGIGEPFDNYDNVMNFVDIINCPYGIGLGSRHITISTCGIIPKIKEFMHHGKQVNLAISLHAPNDTLRSKIMPINRAYPLEELMRTVRKYISVTNRRVTFEYILLRDVNDTEKCALELCSLLKGMNCYVNLIPYNETSHIIYKKSEKDQIMKFYDVLKKHHIQVTIRKEFGTKVSAACGQLRSNYEEGA
ncbi:MAG TPA: 23S rRNA (adenine(2503)-C(2))-methyltransferase RlmN [Candidatus Fimihabitans intestinipullorum]|uniref:Probable dual-specificity RNA methyltransferase RlmN n=1 Tax=Candidatus Fimihabitans intestinipullorum TaxID=2840820 RepID=A0A9D1HWU6_9BACT|nr:23S rRNA (adenine(2503)-C(2))-methyltransferase RlmN [Candidatus Fimihabitans intestinipullorum]